MSAAVAVGSFGEIRSPAGASQDPLEEALEVLVARFPWIDERATVAQKRTTNEYGMSRIDREVEWLDIRRAIVELMLLFQAQYGSPRAA